MCGIAGYVSVKNNFSKTQLATAASFMQHRGPNAEGFYFSTDERVGLAHRRLSILDLSVAANQPMFSKDGRYCIVFNGEVYNFSELKQCLKDKGATLSTTSDTEVIVELFSEKGVACFSLLNGMFSLAIYDLQNKVLTLCRDHVGVKPLYYYSDDDNFIFASELKVIKSLIPAKLSVNPTAIPYFFHLGFIPQPLTIYQNTYKFPAAHYLQINTTKNKIGNSGNGLKQFWRIEDFCKKKIISNETVAKKELENLLVDSIGKQLISDVPIGTFLSGGIDSSIVTAIASKLDSKQLQTFSITVDDGKYNESSYAKAVSNHLQTDHHEFIVKEKNVIDLVDKLISAYDEPFADSSAFPTMMVSMLAKKHVTVALSGDGGDELFYGYGMYNWAKRLSMPGMGLIKDSLFTASKFMNNKYQRAGNMFDYPSKENIITHIFSQEQYFFKEQELSSLLNIAFGNFDEINKVAETARKLSSIEKQALWDFNYYLKDDLLVKVDIASMQYSLETRVPLLDYKLVEFAFNLDSNLKINNGNTKYLLKQVLYDYLPKEIFERPKRGFSIPLVKWLKTDLKYLLDKYTSKEIIEKYAIINFAQVEKMKKAYLNGVDYLYNRLWLIIILHWWLDENQGSFNKPFIV